MSQVEQGSLTARHHAMLFALISRSVIERIGVERGEELVRRVVRQYGEERGGRMALAALDDGQILSMASFLAYGEWRVGPDEEASERHVVGADVRSLVRRCPWHETWEAGDLMQYGRYYCLEIDAALVRGFNPALRLSVNRTLPNDGESCEFVFHDVGERVPRQGRVRSWAYHMGHLYNTASAALAAELGDTGREVMGAAMAALAERYDQRAADTAMGYEDVDFTRLPEPDTDPD